MVISLCNAVFFFLCVLFRLASNATTLKTILHGSVGFLTARSGGHLVSLQCFVSPYDIFDEDTGTQLNLTESNGKCMNDFNHKCLLEE